MAYYINSVQIDAFQFLLLHLLRLQIRQVSQFGHEPFVRDHIQNTYQLSSQLMSQPNLRVHQLQFSVSLGLYLHNLQHSEACPGSAMDFPLYQDPN